MHHALREFDERGSRLEILTEYTASADDRKYTVEQTVNRSWPELQRLTFLAHALPYCELQGRAITHRLMRMTAHNPHPRCWRAR